jgi:Holliday junction resolvase
VNAKKKGARGELEFSSFLRDEGYEAIRGCQNAGRDATGQEAPDVIHNVPGVHFEVKRTEKLRIVPAIDQAAKDAAGKIPIVAWRRNNWPWMAILPMKDLMEFIREWFPVNSETSKEKNND